MKILYFCNVHRKTPTEAGVLKKVLSQCKVLEHVGNEVYLACHDDQTSYTIYGPGDVELLKVSLLNISKLKRESIIIGNVKEFIIKNGIKLMYSRYSNFSYSAHRFYKELKVKGIYTILEVPTYPLSQRWTSVRQSFKSGNVKTALIQTYNSTIGTLGVLFFKCSLNRIVNNNGFSFIWGVPVIQITNGIDVKSIPERNHTYIEKKDILVSSVANVARWHGYDRFIKGLSIYYSKKRERKVYFELAGPGVEVDILKKLVVDLGISQYVHFIGPTTGKELDLLYDRTDIGISILGIHRNKITIIDCLKSREFCARKLPFITQSAEQHFEGKAFTLQVASDESPIDIEEVLKFYDFIVSSPTIIEEMYTFAITHCDWKVAFSNVLSYIKSIDKC